MSATLSSREEGFLRVRYDRLPASLREKIFFKTVLTSIAKSNIDPVIEVCYQFGAVEGYSEDIESFIVRLYLIQHGHQDHRDILPWGDKRNLDALEAHNKLVAKITDEIVSLLENHLNMTEQENTDEQDK